MGLKQFSQNVAVREQVAPALLAAGAANGTTINVLAAANKNANFQGAKAVVHVGAATGTPDSFTVNAKVQDSANDSDWADATDAEGNAYAMTAITAGGIGTIENIDIGRLRQYVRLVVTPAFVNGTSPHIYASAVLVLGNSQENPVT